MSCHEQGKLRKKIEQSTMRVCSAVGELRRGWNDPQAGLATDYAAALSSHLNNGYSPHDESLENQVLACMGIAPEQRVDALRVIGLALQSAADGEIPCKLDPLYSTFNLTIEFYNLYGRMVSGNSGEDRIFPQNGRSLPYSERVRREFRD